MNPNEPVPAAGKKQDISWSLLVLTGFAILTPLHSLGYWYDSKGGFDYYTAAHEVLWILDQQGEGV